MVNLTLGKILCLFGKHKYYNEDLNSEGFRMWHYKVYSYECKFCNKQKIESDSPYNIEKLKQIIEARNRFLQKVQRRRVLIEIASYNYGEMRNFHELSNNITFKYNPHECD